MQQLRNLIDSPRKMKNKNNLLANHTDLLFLWYNRFENPKKIIDKRVSKGRSEIKVR